MTRVFSEFCSSEPSAVTQLNILASEAGVSEYREAMFALGESLGRIVSNLIFNESKVYGDDICLACTVEDADFLASGMLRSLQFKERIAFACFWNQRYSPFKIRELTVAPIIKKYQEKLDREIKYLIIVKSIISGACVVKTNLTDLISKVKPESIYIVAPVVYDGAEASLRKEFNQDINSLFHFVYFAKDTVRNDEGVVSPGVGGMVYDRLGIGDSFTKNEYTPEVVLNRLKTMA